MELYPLASIVIPSTKLIPFYRYGNRKKPFQEAPEGRGKVLEKERNNFGKTRKGLGKKERLKVRCTR